MEQNPLNCKHRGSAKCPNASEGYMVSILKEMDDTNGGGMIPNSKYDLASRLCETCKSFKQ